MREPSTQEDLFLARFWLYADDPARAAECQRAVEVVRDTDFLAENRHHVWRVLSVRFAKGKPLHQHDEETFLEVAEAAGDEVARTVWSRAQEESRAVGFQLARYAKPLVDAARNREEHLALSDIARESAARLERDDDPAATRDWRRDQGSRLLLLLASKSRVAPDGRAEIIAETRDGLDRKGMRGVRWPYPRLERALGGPIYPGRIYGITGLWGSGKSTLLANLFASLTRTGTPCMAAITEDADEWLRRAMAAEADVPQIVAENEMWDADDEVVRHTLMGEWECSAAEVRQRLAFYRQRFAPVVDDFEHRPWAMVDTPDLTPEGLISRFKVLRRQWPGQHVIGMIDHAHNLVYKEGKTDLHIGEAIRQFKQFAKADADEGGMSLLILFQVRKPEKQDKLAGYKPIPCGEIAGRVAMHLNVHFSLFRQWVVTDGYRRTEWGTPGCALENGFPVRADNQTGGQENTHPDDEHIYLHADKARIQGRRTSGGRICTLNLSQPSGRIYELDRRHGDDYGYAQAG
jgi:hypothetical protein